MLKKQSYFAVGLWLLSSFFFVTLAWVSNGQMGGGDTYAHFLISKYSWSHPELFFDHWGKPVFTILSSPFSQFGIRGMVLFNALCGLSTGFMVFLTLSKLKINPFATFALLLSPFFAAIHVSGLTEPLFGLSLIAAAYFLLNRDYFKLALLLGLIPFIRTEGVLIYGLGIIILLIKKDYRASLFSLLPLIFFALVGSIFHNGNVFWLITELPYSAQSSYGEGELLHFARYADIIFGLPLLIFGLLGALYWLLKKAKIQWELTIFFIGIPVSYFLFHSVLYGFGWGASAGLKRVMIVLTPFLVLFSACFIDSFSRFGVKVNYSVKFIFFVAVLAQFLSSDRMPVNQTTNQRVISKAVAAIHSLDKVETVYYYHPMVAVLLDCDPFSGSSCVERIPDFTLLNEHDVIVWDNHFSVVEGNTPKSKIVNIQGVELVQEIEENHEKVVVYQVSKASQ